ncbi:hypothetical protein CYMTET_9075 [Cymbomonas tetramitiformis]|uniref:(S)-ureidoglycine aminohydrolase cupin domain-containing protein n=1 Tax=Cymbomonas tetramitiformis TaxID=36881 RepID=A0AAE0LFH4_9CHLO|nr:hypothetical protein CYMTET_16082 [Cymbomonas tetramitiformis]KAK3283217.1 hypothetical protein CYMTET_9075 [Cymbomonas tetramitiformis]
MATVNKPASLVTLIPAAEVSEELQVLAATWPVWDSKTHPQKPKGSGKFSFDYSGDYDTERVLITKGRATLTPVNPAGGDAICIESGDSVYFHRGFKCNWKVHSPMLKHYAYYGDDGELMPEPEPGITCDICKAGCFVESYFHTGEDGTELDLCPKCFKKDVGKYSGAEKQKFGEPVPAPAKRQKKK